MGVAARPAFGRKPAPRASCARQAACRPGPCTRIVIALVVWLTLAASSGGARRLGAASSGGADSVAYVGQPAQGNATSLLAAISSPAITKIVLVSNYSVAAAHEFDAYRAQPLQIRRNVTIVGPPGVLPLLDFAFERSVLELCASCYFTMIDMGIANERRGNGASIDFFLGKPGSTVELRNGFRLRPACTSTDSTLQLIRNDQQRSRRFPSPSPDGPDTQWVGRANATYQGQTFVDMLELKDFAYDVPRSFQEGKGHVGGFTMVTRNTTRLCVRTVPQDCVLAKGADACVNEVIEEVLAGRDIRNPAPAEGSGAGGPSSVVVGVAVSLAVVAGAAIAGAAALWAKRRRNGHALQRKPPDDQVRSKQLAIGGSGGSGASGRTPPSAGACAELEEGIDPFVEGNVGQARLDQGWEVLAMKTSPSLGPVGACKIHFGVLLGAGSFGRVYKARWAGREVAVKVIEQADSDTAKAVETEVQLMMALQHPNVVKAYHFITYKHSVTATAAVAAAAADASTSSAGASAKQQASSSSTAGSSRPSRSSRQSKSGTQPKSGAQPKESRETLQLLQQQLQQPQQEQLDARLNLLTQQLQLYAAGKGIAYDSAIAAAPAPAAEPLPLGSSAVSNDSAAASSQAMSSPAVHTPSVAAGAPPGLPTATESERADESDSLAQSGSQAAFDAGASSSQQQAPQQPVPPRGALQFVSEPWRPSDEPGQQQALQQARQLPQQAAAAAGTDAEVLRAPSGQQHPPLPPLAAGGEDGGSATFPGSGGSFSLSINGSFTGRPSSEAQMLTPDQKTRLQRHMQRQQMLLLQHSSSGRPRSVGILPPLPPAAAAECETEPGEPVSRRASEATRCRTYIVQEYCDLGTFSSYACKVLTDPSDEEQMLQLLLLLQDAARGLAALHGQSIVHGDVNARNVLIASNSAAPYGAMAKLADLGLSRVIRQHSTHKTTNTVGTLSHMPPELLRHGRMSPAVDIYSFGIMAWEVFTGQPAFRHLHYGQFFDYIVLKNVRPLIPEDCPRDYSLLMVSCWAREPADRPTARSVLECLQLMILDRQEEIGCTGTASDSSVHGDLSTQELELAPPAELVPAEPTATSSAASGGGQR